MEFLKKHYEKIVLCVVLLGLAGAVVWMGTVTTEVQKRLEKSIDAPPHTPPPTNIDLTAEQKALAQMTNPPVVVLSGDHNTFNPVTWKRKSNDELFKVLHVGPDALTVINITPLHTTISFDHAAGEAGVYILSILQHSDPREPRSGSKSIERPKKDEKMKSGLYIIHGIKGAENDPTELNLEIPQTGETNVWISKGNPYKRVDSFIADLRYDPEAQSFKGKKVDDQIKLDNEDYKIVEITNNAVRLESIRTTKVTQVKWTESQNRD